MSSPASENPLGNLSALMQKFSRFSAALDKSFQGLKLVEEQVGRVAQAAHRSPEAAQKIDQLKEQGYFEIRDQAIHMINALGQELSSLEKQVQQLNHLPLANGSRRASEPQNQPGGRAAGSPPELGHGRVPALPAQTRGGRKSKPSVRKITRGSKAFI